MVRFPVSCGLAHLPADGVETRLVDLFADHRDQPGFLAGAGREAAFPMPEGAVAIGDRQQPDMGDVIEQRNRRVQQAIAETLFEVGQRQQLLAQLAAVGELEAADAADLVGRITTLDGAGGDGGVPAVVAVEIAQYAPDPVGRRIDDRAFDDPRHAQPPNARLSASKPPWNTPVPILATSSASRSGAQSNSAVHSTKINSPSVTGVSRSVAT